MKLTDKPQEADLRLRRQRPEGPGGGAGLDAVQSPVRRLDPRQGRQAGAELAPPTSRASTVYKELFDEAAPPGAADYDWGGREESFRQGLVANMQTWSIGAAGYNDPAMSKVVGKAGIIARASGQRPAEEVRRRRLGLGDQRRHRPEEAGGGLGVHQVGHQPAGPQGDEHAGRRQLSPHQRDARSRSAGEVSRSCRSSTRPFENGDGDYRPRIPQYPQIQDLLGTAVNAVLVGNTDPKKALDDAQAEAAKLF